jgi:hypothetical protein
MTSQEQHPLTGLLHVCNGALEMWRKAFFANSTALVFNLGLALINSLDLWASYPSPQWFDIAIIPVNCACVAVLLVHRVHYCIPRRRAWRALHANALAVINADTWNQLEFYNDQLLAAYIQTVHS